MLHRILESAAAAAGYWLCRTRLSQIRSTHEDYFSGRHERSHAWGFVAVKQVLRDTGAARAGVIAGGMWLYIPLTCIFIWAGVHCSDETKASLMQGGTSPQAKSTTGGTYLASALASAIFQVITQLFIMHSTILPSPPRMCEKRDYEVLLQAKLWNWKGLGCTYLYNQWAWPGCEY